MADEKKVRSFRIDDEIAEKIKKITEEIGGNQQAAMAALVSAYEMQNGKALLEDGREQLEQVEQYTNAIVRIVFTLLEKNQNMKETIYQGYEAQLKAKDETIIDLQKGKALAEESEQFSITRLNETEEQLNSIKKELKETIKNFTEKVNTLEKSITDKDELIITIKEAHKSTKNELETMELKINHVTELEEQIGQLQRTLQEKEENIKILQNDKIREKEDYEINMQKAKLDAEAAKKMAVEECEQKYKALLASADNEKLKNKEVIITLKQEYQTQIEQLKASYQEKIDTYQEKYLQLLERMNIMVQLSRQKSKTFIMN